MKMVYYLVFNTNGYVTLIDIYGGYTYIEHLIILKVYFK